MKRQLLSGPYLIWMGLFTIIPLVIVLYYAFTDSITGSFTLKNIASLGAYLPIFLRSVWLSLLSALICLVVGYPVAWTIAQAKPSHQRFFYLLVMLPMCISFLLRTLAWVSLLEDTGIINQLLGRIGVGPLKLMRNSGAVILGMVYNYLPYMIMPLYTVIMKIDSRLVEAAQDLGCDAAQVFRKVTLPLSMPGVMSGVMMVFLPAMTNYVVLDMLYNSTYIMGSLIGSYFNAYNWHGGSMIALVLLGIICIFTLLTDGKEEEARTGGALL